MNNTARWLNKVPEVTLSFWVIKIMSTTVGETGADYLAVDVGFGAGPTSLGMAMLLAATLFCQLRTRACTPWLYWLNVVLVSVVGTQITDILTDKLDVSLYTSTALFSLLLAATFALWYRSERSLSIRDITTARRELFYWATVLCTFALGTAAGDLATEALGLGFTLGAVIFAALIGVTLLAWRMGAETNRARVLGVLKLDWSDVAAPSIVAIKDVVGGAVGTAINNGRVYVAAGAGGLSVLK